jgi:hypothetical protein
MGNRRKLVIIFLASTGLCGCHLLYPFPVQRASDQGGAGDAPLTDARPDASFDLAGDGPALMDQSPQPTDGSVDGASYRPLTTAEIMTAWSKLAIPCLDDQGKSAGPSIKITDTGMIDFIDGGVPLAGAPAVTKAWVGPNPSVVVIWDPNACGTEDPLSVDGNWGEAGLLIRGASIDAQGRLVLAPWVTVTDINMLDVNQAGVFEGEFALPDDSELHLHPQLIETVNQAKATIITLAQS